MDQTLHEQLASLKHLLACERKCARELDMQGLEALLVEKNDLMARIDACAVTDLPAATRQLIYDIRFDIRRNTRLYHFAMHTILGLWTVHCRDAGSQGYGPAGQKAVNRPQRHLLSGKI